MSTFKFFLLLVLVLTLVTYFKIELLYFVAFSLLISAVTVFIKSFKK